MLLQKGAEGLQGLIALAWHDEQYGLLFAFYVDEDGYVVVSPFAGGLILAAERSNWATACAS